MGASVAKQVYLLRAPVRRRPETADDYFVSSQITSTFARSEAGCGWV